MPARLPAIACDYLRLPAIADACRRLPTLAERDVAIAAREARRLDPIDSRAVY